MNHILTAEVILTLTAEQAKDLQMACLYAKHSPVASRSEKDDYLRLEEFIAEQCAKQGVQL